MQWASLDSFTVPDPFWQDKMGKPVAGRDFLGALLAHGSLDRYRIYCLDEAARAQTAMRLAEELPAADFARLDLAVHAALGFDLDERPVDLFHQGDFTFHAPYLADIRAARPAEAAFAISGVTHSLDGANIHTRLLQILLAGPQPCDAVICTSACAVATLGAAFESLRARFDERFGATLPAPPPLAQIPLGLSPALETAEERGACRKAADIPTERFMLLGIGRFSVRRKADLAPLLECIEHLARDLPDLTLVLAGGGTDDDIALVRGLVDRLGLRDIVRIEENVTLARKRALLGAADAFVSLVDNHQETFGISIIEAMAHGLPAIVTDFDGYRELVADGETGFRIPTAASADSAPWDTIAGLLDPSILAFQRSQKIAFDFRALRQALGALARDPGLRHRMGEAARARSRDYRWSAIIPRYEALWRGQRAALDVLRRTNDGGARPALLTPAFDRVFGHYPTRVLDDATPLAISAYARDRVAQGFTPAIYEGLEPQLGFPVMQALMAQLRAAPAPLGTVVGQACAETRLARARVMPSLDFLLKHGYIEIADERADDASTTAAMKPASLSGSSASSARTLVQRSTP